MLKNKRGKEYAKTKNIAKFNVVDRIR